MRAQQQATQKVTVLPRPIKFLIIGIEVFFARLEVRHQVRRDDLFRGLQAFRPFKLIKHSVIFIFFLYFFVTSHTHIPTSLGPEDKDKILKNMVTLHQYSPPPESDADHEQEDHLTLPLYSEPHHPPALHHRPSFLDEIVPLPSPSHFTPVGKDPRTHALRRSVSVAIISIFMLAVIFMASTESRSTAKDAAARLKGVFGIGSVAELGEVLAGNMGLGGGEQSTNIDDEGLAAETGEKSSARPKIGEWSLSLFTFRSCAKNS